MFLISSQKQFAFSAILAISLAGCARHSSDSSTGTAAVSTAALPTTWVTLPENDKSSSASTDTKTKPLESEPSEEANQKIRATLRAHTDALGDISANPAPARTDSKNRTPWHLDGVIADFALTADGIFGALLGEGQAAVKLTWQKQSTQTGKAARSTLVKVTSNTTPAELSRQIEPTVRAALASGSVKNEAALRSNLNRQALDFLTVSRMLSRVPSFGAWTLNGYRLILTFDASGQVTPLASLGGTGVIMLNWEKPDTAAEQSNAPSSERERRILQGITEIAQVVEPALTLDTTGNQNGLVIDELHLGVGISAAGDIGIAHADTQVFGKLLFTRSVSAAMQDAQFEIPQDTSLNLISQGGSSSNLEYAVNEGIVSTHQPDGRGVIYRISAGRFRKGLGHALRMASYFADRAREVNLSTWPLTEIEAGFTTSISGQLRLVTVGGSAQVEVDYHPWHKE